MRRNVIEIITGAVVLVAAIAFLVFAYTRSGVSAVEGYEVTVKFSRVDGLANGSEVRISGIRVGTVVDQELDPANYLATVHLRIASEIRLPTDTSARIQSDNLLANNYVMLEPGADDTYLEDGDEIVYAQAPINLADLIARLVLGVADQKTKGATPPEGSTGGAPDFPSLLEPEPAESGSQP
jgi:phospholipid/cholesterol/gamma-HCH transport system substrate-binding protein